MAPLDLYPAIGGEYERESSEPSASRNCETTASPGSAEASAFCCMPRWASRLTLRITDVRVQRVQEMTLGDAKAEGLPNDEPIGQWFPMLWDSINAKRGYSCASNPWVWAITFERVA